MACLVSFVFSLALLLPCSCLAIGSRQIGLGISETENIGDEAGELGENLSLANLEGAGHNFRTAAVSLFASRQIEPAM